MKISEIIDEAVKPSREDLEARKLVAAVRKGIIPYWLTQARRIKPSWNNILTAVIVTNGHGSVANLQMGVEITQKQIYVDEILAVVTSREADDDQIKQDIAMIMAETFRHAIQSNHVLLSNNVYQRPHIKIRCPRLVTQMHKDVIAMRPYLPWILAHFDRAADIILNAEGWR